MDTRFPYRYPYMLTLIVAEATRPMLYAKSTRWQYRVLLPNGKIIKLPKLAEMLKISYPTLAKRVHHELAVIGTHTDAFTKIVAEVKKGSRQEYAKNNVCPKCKRPLDAVQSKPSQPLTPEVTSHDDDSSNINNPG